MDSLLRQVSIQFLCMVPLVIVLFVIRLKQRALRAASRVPFAELPRRPAGESLRLKIETYDDRIGQCINWLAGIPVLLGAIGGLKPAAGFIFPTVLFLVSLIWTAACGRRLYCLSRERANYQLGFDGERYVGEELSRLAAYGYEVYHDVPFDGYNIDHILVGPGGVFSIETKTYRKPIAGQKKQYHVLFDGRRLHWPWGPKTDEIDQAERNAKSLSQELGSGVGERVFVQAILTIPGWMIDWERILNPTVRVLSPTQIVGECRTADRKLGDSMIKRISHQLNQKCKLGLD